MTAFRIAAAFALLVLLAGCETFVDADPTDFTPAIAVEGTFEAGQPWSLLLTRTVPLGSGIPNGYSPIDDATVTITAGDGTAVTLPRTSQSGVYGAEQIPSAPGTYPGVDDPVVEAGPAPEAGRTYTLRVEAPGLPPVTATSRTPEMPSGAAVRLVRGWDPHTMTFGGRTITTYSNPVLAVTLAPRSAQERLEVSFVWAGLVSDGNGAAQDCRGGIGTFFTDAPVLRESTFLNDLQGGPRRRLFSAFPDFETLGAGPVVVEIEGESAGGCFVGANVLAVSADYFRYRQSQERRQSAEGNPFAEPVQAFSNVSGGVGVFAGTTRARLRIRR